MSQYAADVARQPSALARVVAANASQLARARALLADSCGVRLAAVGSSRHAAGYGAAVLDVAGGRVAVVLDAPGVAVPRRPPQQGDALVIVSQSGATEPLLPLAAQARRVGARVIAVVNDVHGAVAQEADVVLDCGFGPEHVIPATGSVTTAMLLLRALAADLPQSAVQELADAVGQLVSCRWAIEAAPSRVVAGGLAGEWVAEEIALKLAEVAGVAACADSVVDFLHGPVAVPAPTLAVLDPDDPNSVTVAGLPTVITAGPSPEYTYSLAAVDDPTLAPIVRVVAGQLIAAAVARAVGADPDDARGLRKVTITS